MPDLNNSIEEQRSRAYVLQQEELMARKDEQLSKLYLENTALKEALDRRDASNDLTSSTVEGRYRQAAIKAYVDGDNVTISEDAAVIVEPAGAYVATWVYVSAVQAGIDDGSDVVPSVS